jgi:hypothetical protein
MSSTDSSNHEADTDVVGLVTWLQTFEVFPHRLVDGSIGPIAVDSVYDALSDTETAR